MERVRVLVLSCEGCIFQRDEACESWNKAFVILE